MAMQRVLTFVILLALAIVPLEAQRHVGGGGHVGMRGPSAGFGAHGGYYSGGHYSFGATVGSHRGPYYGGGHYYGHGGHYYGYGGHYYNYYPRYYWPSYSWGIGFYYGYPSYYYPYYGGYYSYPYPYAYYATPSYPVVYSSGANASASSGQQLSQDMTDLRAEVRDLRDSNDQLRNEIAQSRSSQEQARYPRPPVKETTSPTSPSSEQPAALLVFKDGRRVETKSYAVVGQTVWVLSDQQAHKYPLSQLDLDETRKVNAERGVEFAVPNR